MDNIKMSWIGNMVTLILEFWFHKKNCPVVIESHGNLSTIKTRFINWTNGPKCECQCLTLQKNDLRSCPWRILSKWKTYFIYLCTGVSNSLQNLVHSSTTPGLSGAYLRKLLLIVYSYIIWDISNTVHMYMCWVSSCISFWLWVYIRLIL